MPFENLSGRSEYNWIGESFAESLSESLDGPSLSAIGPEERDVAYKEEGLPSAAILTHAAMFKIAEMAGADLVVMGTYRVEGEGRTGTLLYTARTVNIIEGRLAGREQNGGGPILDIQKLQGELAYQILSQQDPGLSAASEAELISAATAVPIGAFESYVKGDLTREHDARLELLERAAKEYSDKTRGKYAAALFELGKIHFEDGEYQQALDDFSAVAAGDHRSEEALFYTSVAESQLGGTDRALAILEQLKGPMPLVEVYNNLGVLLLKKNRFEDALAALKPASDAAPRDTDVLFNAGYASFLKGDNKDAAAFLSRELERRPADPEALYLEAKALAATGVTDASARASDQAKRLLPAYAAWEVKGVPFIGRLKHDFSKINYYRYKRGLGARADSQDAAESPAGLLAAALAAYKAGQDEQALGLLSRLLEAEPQNYEAHLLVGQVYERRGDTDQATNSLKAALFWNPKLVRAMVLLGRIALLKHDCKLAGSWLRKALETKPADPDALALQRLEAQTCGAPPDSSN